MNWHPISEKPTKTGLYLVCARSADPEKPFRHIAYYFVDDDAWSGLVPQWLEALSYWMEYPELPPIIIADESE